MQASIKLISDRIPSARVAASHSGEQTMLTYICTPVPPILLLHGFTCHPAVPFCAWVGQIVGLGITEVVKGSANQMNDRRSSASDSSKLARHEPVDPFLGATYRLRRLLGPKVASEHHGNGGRLLR